jgi:hypothetical protein
MKATAAVRGRSSQANGLMEMATQRLNSKCRAKSCERVDAEEFRLLPFAHAG